MNEWWKWQIFYWMINFPFFTAKIENKKEKNYQKNIEEKQNESNDTKNNKNQTPDYWSKYIFDVSFRIPTHLIGSSHIKISISYFVCFFALSWRLTRVFNVIFSSSKTQKHTENAPLYGWTKVISVFHFRLLCFSHFTFTILRATKFRAYT